MSLRSPFMFACAFITLAIAYSAWFNVVVRIDPAAAQSRFDALIDSRSPGRAVSYGERLLVMGREAGLDEEALAPLKSRLAVAHIARRNYARGAALVEQSLASEWGRQLETRARIDMEDKLARAYALAGDFAQAAAIYAAFLDRAGDAAARGHIENPDALEIYYAQKVQAAANLFAENLKPTEKGDKFPGAREARLVSADHLAALGAFYAMRAEDRYAAAGLLSAALAIRTEHLGAQDQGVIQIVLVLGPVYADMGRLDEAEKLYLAAFHAQERAKGSNSPDLSLYIRLLSGIYERQGRATEAQALNEHMRSLFRDAFGAQRYAVNRVRDRKSDVDRPVSQHFVLGADYRPADLVSAARYSIPLSKNSDLEEMRLRLAADEGDDPREANLPARLAQLISLCRSDTGENISLRSGYRSYQTQHDLYGRIGHRGTVTPPGMSEHQLGLAVDIDVDRRLMRRSDATYQCFEENAFRFGFILSYPPGNNYLPGADSYEPWHWRYVGVATAHLYREAGPMHKPQEFLAAIDCYRSRAAAGAFPVAGEADVCLAEPDRIAAAATPSEPAQPAGETPGTARKLNNARRGAGLQ